MFPPMKPYLDITQEEMFELLQEHCNGDITNLDPKIINETLKPYLRFAFDIPEDRKLEIKMEREFTNIHGKPSKVMKKFLKYMDSVNLIFKKYSPCKKGCSNCCFIPVKVSSLEASLIIEYLNKNVITNYRQKEMSINDLIKKNNYSFFGEEFNGIKCPFMKNNECIIYDARPYVCRRYITFEDDNKKCGWKEGNITLFTSYTTEKFALFTPKSVSKISKITDNIKYHACSTGVCRSYLCRGDSIVHCKYVSRFVFRIGEAGKEP